ncbi:MAG: dephospho-CoA kinase, partial [Anaerolineae bacterium]|nr:dephospho-CoA kinase [Anaerolineae bacterium]
MGRWANKYVIGLTGNIAMGKSVVRKMLEHLGAYTIDADGLAHQTMAPGAPAYHPIIETFGRWVLDPDGRINRQKLAAVAFAHPDALAQLEAITHPVVRQAIDVLLSRAPQPVAVVEAIKLVEGPLADQVDSVWVVDAAPQLQVERLVHKRGMTENEARKRMETQNPQRDKLARADAVITNNGSLQDVWVQVEREWRRLMAAFGLADADTTLRTVRVSPSRPPTGQYPAVKPPTGQLATPRPPTGPLGRPVVTPTQTQTMQQVQGITPTSPAQPVALPAQRPATGPLGPLPALKPKTQSQTLPAAAAPAASSAPAPATPLVPTPAPALAPSAPDISVDIRRGMPRHAEAIAELIASLTGKSLTRSDVMGLFGEKSYLLAETSGRLLGLAGFQVENLITRVD